jgi:hypothetical protein
VLAGISGARRVRGPTADASDFSGVLGVEEIALTTPDSTVASPAALPPVLLAEDEPVSRRLLEATLRRWGHEVVVTVDGDEAWAALQRPEVPSVAILARTDLPRDP